MFKLDTYFNILSFHCRGINISWGISSRIKYLDVKYFDKDGYVEFNTNIGLESIDIIDDFITKKQAEIIKKYLSSISKLEVNIE